MNFQNVYDFAPYMIQQKLFSAYCSNLYKKRYGAKFDVACKKLEEFEKLSQTEMIEYQDEKLRLLINHCYTTVPYYNKVMKERKLTPADIRGQSDLYKFPVLEREDIAKYGTELISTKYDKNKLVHGHTSGTTGSPLNFYWDSEMWFMNNVFDWRQKRWVGMQLGDAYGIFLGRTIVPVRKVKPPFWQFNKYENQLWFSSFHLSEEYIRVIYDRLLSFKPLFLEGYPSTLYILAKLLQKNRLKINLKGALTSSETLFDNQKEIIEEVFACKVYDYYGQAERVIWGTECNHHKGKHLNMDYGVTEIVDSHNNQLPNGNIGHFLGTSLLNYGMPFIRYKIGDISCIEKDECSCGCKMPLMSNVCTKQEDVIITPTGRYISASVLTHPFKPLKNIIMSQIIQDNINHVIVKIVINEAYNENDSIKLIAALSERLGEGINIDLEIVESIDREISGKFKWLKSYIK